MPSPMHPVSISVIYKNKTKFIEIEPSVKMWEFFLLVSGQKIRSTLSKNVQIFLRRKRKISLAFDNLAVIRNVAKIMKSNTFFTLVSDCSPKPLCNLRNCRYRETRIPGNKSSMYKWIMCVRFCLNIER